VRRPMTSYTRYLSALTILTLAVFVSSLFVGRYTLGLGDVLSGEPSSAIFWQIRLPRVLAAAVLGAVLAVAGVAFQSAFKNPLVGPSILGISQGAAFGAAFAILLLSSNPVMIELSSTMFALAAFAAAYRGASAVRYGDRVLRLVLSGLVVSAIFSGGLGILKSMADPLSQLPELTYWLLGGLSGALWGNLLYMLPLSLVGLVVIFLLRWRINLLSLDDEVAESLGADPVRLRRMAIVAGVVAVASVTSVAGVVSWLGLLAPHIARKLFGVDTGKVVPASAVIGASVMMVCDDLARSLAPGEIALGTVVSLLCAPLFLFLLARRETA